MKLDGAGTVVWNRIYFGTSADNANSIQQTSDGGYIVAGQTGSDAWVLKLDGAGSFVWQKAYGGPEILKERIRSGRHPTEVMSSPDGRDPSGAGSDDAWVLKLDGGGDIVWQKAYGGLNADNARSIQQTSDGGYVVAGWTGSFGAGSDDAWVLKLDGSGDPQWQKTYGGAGLDYAHSIRQTSVGGYVVAGRTRSFGAGSEDAWVLKIKPGGPIDASCLAGLGADSTAIPVSTAVAPSSTTALVSVIPPGAGVTDTTVTPADSSVTAQTQCDSLGTLQMQTLVFSTFNADTPDGATGPRR